MAAEELLQRLRVHVERRVQARVPRDRLDDCVGYLGGLVPVGFEPLLELCDFTSTLDLDVEFDVLGEARRREVAGPHQRLGSDHFQLGMRDVGLGVELVLVVDPALDLPRAQCVENGWDAVEKGVGGLVGLDAAVEDLDRTRPHGVEERSARPVRRLVAHQDSDLVERLPFPVERQKGADLEVTCGDIERLRNPGPLLEIPKPGPARDAVVDDEEVPAFGVSSHGDPCMMTRPRSERLTPR